MKNCLVVLGLIFSFSVFANEVPFPESQGLYRLGSEGVSDGTTTCAPYLLSSINSSQDGLILEELDSETVKVLASTEFILGEELSLDGKKKEVTRFSGSLLIKQNYKKNVFGKFQETTGLNINYSEAGGLEEKDNIFLEKTKDIQIVIQCNYYRVK